MKQQWVSGELLVRSAVAVGKPKGAPNYSSTFSCLLLLYRLIEYCILLRFETNTKQELKMMRRKKNSVSAGTIGKKELTQLQK